MSTLRVSNIEAKADVSSPTVDEKLKITNSSGDALFHLNGKTTGITTVGVNTTGNTFTVDSNNNVTFSGSVTSSGISTFSNGLDVTGGTVAIGRKGAVSSKFHIVGDDTGTDVKLVRFQNPSTSNLYLYYADGSDANSDWRFETGGSENLELRSGGAADLIFSAGYAEKVRIKSDGYVGIGTDAPAEKLQVSGNTNTTIRIDNYDDSEATLFFHNTGSYDRKIVTANADMIFYGGAGATNEHVRITSAGNVGIGLTNPDTELHIKTNSATGPTIRLEGTAPMGADDLIGGIDFFNIDGSGNGPQVGVSLRAYTEGAGGNGGYLIVGVQDSTTGSEGDDTQEAFRVTTAGNIAFPSGQGIDFSATADGSGTTTSELLDDYEEGTWTPVLEGSTTNPTYNGSQSGNYTKVGNMVTCWGYIDTNPVTGAGSGNISISGLPFASGLPNASTFNGNVAVYGPTFSGTLSSRITNGSTSIIFFQIASNTAISQWTFATASWSSGDAIYFQVSYTV